ncbi:MAG: Uma2 family endonuclease [Gammaproteobacteria bacterium]|nr:Uma2 family endonuclease [Gammaproteobacteria bacterium]
MRTSIASSATSTLIEGEIIDLEPATPPHAGTVLYLNHVLFPSLADLAILSVHNPVRLGRFSEPEPDIAVLRRREDFYRSGHPEGKDVLLIIEVADTSARFDREVKMPLYARHGIVEAWLVDLENRHLEVFRDPQAEGYRDIRPVPALDRLWLLALPGIELNLADLFPG